VSEDLKRLLLDIYGEPWTHDHDLVATRVCKYTAKLDAEIERLGRSFDAMERRAIGAEARAEALTAEKVSLIDCINTELRENMGAHLQAEWTDGPLNETIKVLVDRVRYAERARHVSKPSVEERVREVVTFHVKGLRTLTWTVLEIRRVVDAAVADAKSNEDALKRWIEHEGKDLQRDLDAAREKVELKTMKDRAADAMAEAIDFMVSKMLIDARSPAADARLDYGDPTRENIYDRAARLAEALDDVDGYLFEVAAINGERGVYYRGRQIRDKIKALGLGLDAKEKS
jgi:hypothetical protein